MPVDEEGQHDEESGGEVEYGIPAEAEGERESDDHPRQRVISAPAHPRNLSASVLTVPLKVHVVFPTMRLTKSGTCERSVHNYELSFNWQQTYASFVQALVNIMLVASFQPRFHYVHTYRDRTSSVTVCKTASQYEIEGPDLDYR